jgi:hypothetical protein
MFRAAARANDPGSVFLSALSKANFGDHVHRVEFDGKAPREEENADGIYGTVWVQHARPDTLSCQSGEVLSAARRNSAYSLCFRRRTLMKATRWDEFSGPERINRQKSTPKGPDESLFSLLLKFESRLSEGVKQEFQHGIGRRKSPKLRGLTVSAFSNLSRYIE